MSATTKTALHGCNYCRKNGKWSSEGGAVYGYSFWLTVLATLAFIINILIILFTTRNPRELKKVRV